MDPLPMISRADSSFGNQPDPIAALRANVSQQEALAAFCSMSISGLYWRTTRGPLQKLALMYLPFFLYHVSYEVGATRHSRWFALDRVQGALDLFEFPSEPSREHLIQVESRNHVLPSLDETAAEIVLRDKLLRIIFQQGFFRVRDLRLQIQKSTIEFSMPYWLGLYGLDGGLRCRVMDAVRRRMEGEKATELFENWLAA
ncbi:MAG: hypothetical protein WCE52_15160 [Candidatus Acidiferrum sp.]